MSSFLSAVHTQLYTKMRYQDRINDDLLLLLQKQEPSTQPLLEHKLTDGELENVIDLQNIHGWLHEHIVLLEYRTNYFLKQLEIENLMEEATSLMKEIGEQCANGQIFSDSIQAFTFLQQYMLNGMPCDFGLKLLEKSSAKLCFQCPMEIHDQIDNTMFYGTLRFFWIQGVLVNSPITVIFDKIDTYQLMKKEGSTCII